MAMGKPSLHEQVCDGANLLLAWRHAARGKRRQAGVAAYEHALEENLFRLREGFRSMTWQPGPYTSFTIHEPKRRLISAAPFRDRVAHHALCNVTAPLVERCFATDSFANRIGFGTHRALDACQRYARRFPYVLAMDIMQFFPAIDHGLLLGQLRKQVGDPNVLELLRRVLAGGAGVLDGEYRMQWFPGDTLLDRFRPRGLPIGNLTSQIWANLYLTPLDHFIKRELRCLGYVRYVDDFRLFSHDKAQLWEWRDRIVTYLQKWRLVAHPGAQPHPVSNGVGFLGFLIWPERRRVKRRKVVHAMRRLRHLVEEVEAGTASVSELSEFIRSWLAHVQRANTVGLRRATIGRIRVRLGAVAAAK
jgi:RNA-directed DNA polymerase